MYDQEQRDWLAGRDYEMAAALKQPAEGPGEPVRPDELEPGALPTPGAETYDDAVRRAGVTELPDSLPPRDALLGDLGGGPSLTLLDKLVRDGRFEDDNPPGAPWRRCPR